MAYKKFICVFLCLILLNGCTTTKGASLEASGKDNINIFGFIKSVDDWIQRNIW